MVCATVRAILHSLKLMGYLPEWMHKPSRKLRILIPNAHCQICVYAFIPVHWRSSHYAVTHVRNKNIQGRSPNVVKVIFHATRNCSGSKLFPLMKVPISKRDAIEEKHCLIQLSPFDVRTIFGVLLSTLRLSVIAH